MIRKFLLRLLIFLLPFVTFFVYVEIGLGTVPTSYSVLNNNFNLRKDKIEVLVIGDSESQLGIAPKYFQKYKGYNLSNVSQTVYTSTRLVLNNVDKMDSLKMVVFNISPILFMYVHPENWREKFYYHFWGLEPEWGESDITWNFKSGIYDFPTIFGYAMKGFVNIPVPYIENIDSLGWESGYLENSAEMLNSESGKGVADAHLSIIGDYYPTRNVEYLKELIHVLRKRDIQLIFIMMPKSRYYIEHLPAEFIQWNDHLFDSIQHAEGIPVYNFRDNPQFTDSDYRDVNHLNYVGAEKLSVMLSEVIEKHLE